MLSFHWPLTALAVCILAAPCLSAPAQSADDFVDSLGVGVHLSYSDTAYGLFDEVVKPRLQELGVRHVRDGLSGGDDKKELDATTIRKLNELAKLGIKSTMILPPNVAQNAARELLPSIVAVESANEPDLGDLVNFQYKDQKGIAGALLFHRELAAALRESPDSQVRALPLLPPSLVFPDSTSKMLAQNGGQPLEATMANMHSYAGDGLPGGGLESYIMRAETQVGGKMPVVATETGFHTWLGDTPNYGISERAQAKYVTRNVLEHFRAGVERTFSYELVDGVSSWNAALNGQNVQSKWGLLRDAATLESLKAGGKHQIEPKPAFTALKNLIALLNDPAPANAEPFAPASLAYSLVGEDVTALRQVLLQKRDGKFYLVLWQNLRSYDVTKKEDLSPPARSVTLVLNQPLKTARAFRPVEGVTPTVLQASANRQLELSVGDEPLIVELDAGALAGAPRLETQTDTLDNFAGVADKSNWELDASNVAFFDGDQSRALRGSNDAHFLTWNKPNLRGFEAKIYFANLGSFGDANVRASVSPDGVTWRQVLLRRGETTATKESWFATSVRADDLSENTNWVKLEFAPPTFAAWSPQLGEIKFSVAGVTNLEQLIIGSRRSRIVRRVF